jgi:hypothetical protein
MHGLVGLQSCLIPVTLYFFQFFPFCDGDTQTIPILQLCVGREQLVLGSWIPYREKFCPRIYHAQILDLDNKILGAGVIAQAVKPCSASMKP